MSGGERKDGRAGAAPDDWFVVGDLAAVRELPDRAPELVNASDPAGDVAAGYKGSTALHCAAKAGFVQVVEALIEYGADVNAANDRGWTPLDAVEQAARSIDREPVRRVLTAHGARRSGS